MLTPLSCWRGSSRACAAWSEGHGIFPARQQTMRATIAWSYDLLDENEQRDFRRLATFSGGCTIQAAETVCESTLERLSALAEHSLLHRTTTASGSRFAMLETIREYAVEQLQDSGELERTSRRHLEYFLEHGRRLQPGRRSRGPAGLRHRQRRTGQSASRDRMGAPGRTDRVSAAPCRSAGELLGHARPRRGQTDLRSLLDVDTELPARLRAQALRALGGSAHVVGEHEWPSSLPTKPALFQTLEDRQGSRSSTTASPRTPWPR